MTSMLRVCDVQGVTTMLFPLSVIKTRQMASHGVSGGFQASALSGTLPAACSGPAPCCAKTARHAYC